MGCCFSNEKGEPETFKKANNNVKIDNTNINNDNQNSYKKKKTL
jgi:hypothetical protein